MHTILLVEDEILLREGVQEVLEIQGFTVIGAADGLEALEWLSRTQVDLIITDLVMPKMNGVDFVEQVRSRYKDLPIIVASGSGTSVTKRLGIDSIDIPGATASIAKPFKSSELFEKINQLMKIGS
jgi:DNA-binding response OmpR family regulator